MKNISYGKKVVYLGLQCFVLMFSAFIVWGMAYSREETNRSTSRSITSEWGGPVTMTTPTLGCSTDSVAGITPLQYRCEAAVEAQSLHRGIYEAEVYNASVTISGTFSKAELPVCADSLATLKLTLPAAQLVRTGELRIAGHSLKWKKEAEGLSATLPCDSLPEIIDFATVLEIRGSGALRIGSEAASAEITIAGTAHAPSFHGTTPPAQRSVEGSRFSATWVEEDSTNSYASTSFLTGVDRYQKVCRSIKYAFMLILLTFICVMFTEIVLGQVIPMLNYFLIGAALVLFYCLLLSFAEHMTFGYAYLAASAMIIPLITAYMWLMLRSRKAALTMAGLLTALYVICYIMLCLSDYALLMGSLLLFVALAALMYGSVNRRI